MPRTKLQEIVYAVLMTFFMVLAMEFYNTGLRMGGMTNEGFFMAFSEMRIMVPVCFVMGYFFMDRIAPKIAFKMVTPGEDKEIFCVIVRAAVTVCLMCPVMSFWATLIFKQPGTVSGRLAGNHCHQFSNGLCWQIFFCGPLVRFLFRTIFKGQLEKQAAESQG